MQMYLYSYAQNQIKKEDCLTLAVKKNIFVKKFQNAKKTFGFSFIE